MMLPTDKCNCRKCLRERKEGSTYKVGDMEVFIPAERQMMICCIQCGNKRCPHATDHNYACTNSNEFGQEGSYYND